MPRPGTRDWHSDTHQPMRSTIIQQLLRVLHESHSPVITKNKEWQEKLPIVVLKAEEIMYSKANSEAEYMDFQTLWERVNDAVNTIIRRGESTETEDLLPPCVEAGLNLGCVPVSASRSQCNMNPSSYLSKKPGKFLCSSSKITTTTKNQNHHLTHRFVNQPNQPNPPNLVITNPPRLSIKSKSHVSPNSIHINNISPNVGPISPSNYVTQFQEQPQRSPFPFQNSNPIYILGTPVFPSMTESPILGCSKSPILETNIENNQEIESEPRFDLSLKLGLFKEPCLEPEKGPVDDIKKELLFFHVETSNDPSGFGTSRWRFENEGHGEGPAVKKCKTLFGINLEDRR